MLKHAWNIEGGRTVFGSEFTPFTVLFGTLSEYYASISLRIHPAHGEDSKSTLRVDHFQNKLKTMVIPELFIKGKIF